MTPAERRRALARAAVGPAANSCGTWVDQETAHTIADAVLAAIAPALEHCTHYRAQHDQHHDQPITGCPWCTSPGQTTDVPTRGLI